MVTGYKLSKTIHKKDTTRRDGNWQGGGWTHIKDGDAKE